MRLELIIQQSQSEHFVFVRLNSWNHNPEVFGVATFSSYYQILARRSKIPQKANRNISRHFYSSFQGHVQPSLKYAAIQKVNWRSQPLDQTHFTILLLLNWLIIPHLVTWRSGYCYLNKGECNLNQSKDDSFVERMAKNNS